MYFEIETLPKLKTADLEAIIERYKLFNEDAEVVKFPEVMPTTNKARVELIVELATEYGIPHQVSEEDVANNPQETELVAGEYILLPIPTKSETTQEDEEEDDTTPNTGSTANDAPSEAGDVEEGVTEDQELVALQSGKVVHEGKVIIRVQNSVVSGRLYKDLTSIENVTFRVTVPEYEAIMNRALN